MAFSLGGLGGSIGKMAMSWAFWLLFLVFLMLVSFGGLWLRKKGKLRYPTLIVQNLGNGKANLIPHKSGLFK